MSNFMVHPKSYMKLTQKSEIKSERKGKNLSMGEQGRQSGDWLKRFKPLFIIDER